jgi:hypothetical protein
MIGEAPILFVAIFLAFGILTGRILTPIILIGIDGATFSMPGLLKFK